MYGLITLSRNKLYDWNIFKSTSFNTAIISVGNLSVGGTGKTPHIEYLINLLSQNWAIATLSRGYKRKTKGYLLADENSTSELIGDEPQQYNLKYKFLNVAVCEDRVLGVKKILKDIPNTKIILLDDAYQHRSITPGVNILITDFNNLFYKDCLIPSGRLREKRFGYKRADIIIVSKSPKNIDENEMKSIQKYINPLPNQTIFFSSINYTSIKHFTPSQAKKIDLIDKNTSILLVTGIAKPKALHQYLIKYYNRVEQLPFADHHNYNKTDIKNIKNIFFKLKEENKIIITTEKDIMRLSLPEILSEIKDIPIFYIPIEVEFIGKDKERFDKQILEYVKRNTRD